MTTLPGTITSPTAGPLLRRGAPVIGEFTESRQYKFPGEVTRGIAWGFDSADGCWDVVWYEGWVSGGPVRLHLDLTDPAGMDLAARWLARHHGLTVGATAPGWHYNAALRAWFLKGSGYNNDIGFASDRDSMKAADQTIPGISAITDPASALRLAILAAATSAPSPSTDQCR